MASRRDIYHRRSTSESRGRTIQRIMDYQHAPGTLPGAGDALADRPAGSIAAAIMAFHADWVEAQPVTTRRAYERSLTFFARDLAEHGPSPTSPIETLNSERIVEHLDWRLVHGLQDPGEIQRAALHLARLCEWANEHLEAGIDVDRAWVRERAAERVQSLPPAFHVATSSEQLRGG